MKIIGRSFLCMLCMGILFGMTGCEKRRTPRPASERTKNVEPKETEKTASAPAAPAETDNVELRPEDVAGDRPGIVTEIQNTVSGMAGGSAFKAGQKMKQKVRNIQSQHNKQLDDALKD